VARQLQLAQRCAVSSHLESEQCGNPEDLSRWGISEFARKAEKTFVHRICGHWGFGTCPPKPKRRSFTEFVAVGDLEPARQSRKDVRSPNLATLGWLVYFCTRVAGFEFLPAGWCRLYEVRDFEILRDLRFYAILSGFYRDFCDFIGI
jgi:hypothetical protein